MLGLNVKLKDIWVFLMNIITLCVLVFLNKKKQRRKDCVSCKSRAFKSEMVVLVYKPYIIRFKKYFEHPFILVFMVRCV